MPKKDSAAVAENMRDQGSAAVAEKNTADDVRWIWGETSDETMHPFWAVRRLTEAQLKMEQATFTDTTGKLKPRFNCRLEECAISNVIIAAPKDNCLNLTRTITIPFLTNSMPLQNGEEFIIEVAAKKAAASQHKRNWRDAMRETDRATVAAGAAQKKNSAN